MWLRLTVISCISFAVSGLFLLPDAPQDLLAAEETNGPGAVAFSAVEDDMHEFMEYAFEPFFAVLKKSLATEPAERRDWVPVKANSLALAEAGNLLLMRGPEEDREEWNRMAIELREAGRVLYGHAKKRDYPLAQESYRAFVKKCNACHDKFAEGEHQQEP